METEIEMMILYTALHCNALRFTSVDNTGKYSLVIPWSLSFSSICVHTVQLHYLRFARYGGGGVRE